MLHDFRSPGRDARIGTIVARARRDAGMTQTDLARRIGMSMSMLSKLEIGARHWTLEAISEATRILDLPRDMGTAASDMPDAHTSPAKDTKTSRTIDMANMPEVDRRLMMALHDLLTDRTHRLAA